MKPSTHHRGFSLIEALVAMTILSFGLLGLAGLLFTSVRVNHSAYLRTQAAFLAQDMAERMSANIVGVWNGDYGNDTAKAYGTDHTGAATACIGISAACSPQAIAQRDGLVFSNQLVAFLPSPSASIQCVKLDGAIVPDATQLMMQPPFSGTCNISIRWQELAVSKNQSAATQTFDVVFQP